MAASLPVLPPRARDQRALWRVFCTFEKRSVKALCSAACEQGPLSASVLLGGSADLHQQHDTAAPALPGFGRKTEGTFWSLPAHVHHVAVMGKRHATCPQPTCPICASRLEAFRPPLPVCTRLPVVACSQTRCPTQVPSLILRLRRTRPPLSPLIAFRANVFQSHPCFMLSDESWVPRVKENLSFGPPARQHRAFSSANSQ